MWELGRSYHPIPIKSKKQNTKSVPLDRPFIDWGMWWWVNEFLCFIVGRSSWKCACHRFPGNPSLPTSWLYRRSKSDTFCAEFLTIQYSCFSNQCVSIVLMRVRRLNNPKKPEVWALSEFSLVGWCGRVVQLGSWWIMEWTFLSGDCTKKSYLLLKTLYVKIDPEGKPKSNHSCSLEGIFGAYATPSTRICSSRTSQPICFGLWRRLYRYILQCKNVRIIVPSYFSRLYLFNI